MHVEEQKMYLSRCKRFFEHWGEERFLDAVSISAEYATTSEPVPWAKRLELTYKPLRVGEIWGGKWQSAWMHLTGKVPMGWKKGEVALYLNVTGEAMIFDDDGVPIYAVTGGCNVHRYYTKEVYPMYNVKGGGKIDLWIEAAGNALFGIFQTHDPTPRDPEPDGHFTGYVQNMAVVRVNNEMCAFLTDFELLLDIIKDLPEKDCRYRRILRSLNQAVAAFGENPANATRADKFLRREFSNTNGSGALTAISIGHAHIDTAWLWSVRETRRKCARTFSNQLALMDRYPDYIFGASSPQHYAMIKEDYPELYERIKKRVAEGRWELQGGMWVEADCNIISGESMVRQFLHGKNFFMDEFGVDVKNLWIPDVFGYSANLPQITALVGCDTLLTQKISWSETNHFPYHTFRWRGIDGTEVLTHFPPADTYTGAVLPSEYVAAQNQYNESAIVPEFIYLFGIGDGGCGPAEGHVERALRLKNVEGVPKVKFGRADELFARMHERFSELPVWTGELYLELHRGTLTTQGHTKKNNRNMEQRLTGIEKIYSALPMRNYPAKELDKLWKVLLLNQFHDIIPGSSIRMVYTNNEREYAEAFAAIAGLADKAFKKLFSADENAITLVNTLDVPYTLPIALPESWRDYTLLDADGNKVPTGNMFETPMFRMTVPAHGSATLRKGKKLRATTAKKPELDTKNMVLENDLVRYRFNVNGELVEAYDKTAKRSILRAGENGNRLRVYIDIPNNYDAWDVAAFYRDGETISPLPFSASYSKSAFGQQLAFLFYLPGGKTQIAQVVALNDGSKALHFETMVDWHESHKMLRVSFPVDIHTDEESYDIQYGYTKRPIHGNTSWDAAKFEVSGQRYADLSESDYGVALLNDCKYGYLCDRCGDLDLNLLRSPKYPDWQADMGEHIFTYTLLPHEGDLPHSDVIEMAKQVNRQPFMAVGFNGDFALPVSLQGDHVTLEVLKKAEKSGDLICRLVETSGSAGSAELAVPSNCVVSETDAMEWHDQAQLPIIDGKVTLNFRAFEIKTLRIKSARKKSGK